MLKPLHIFGRLAFLIEYMIMGLSNHDICYVNNKVAFIQHILCYELKGVFLRTSKAKTAPRELSLWLKSDCLYINGPEGLTKLKHETKVKRA